MINIVVQHIEDLTQEKFSLKRALESSRSLAESLTSENSSLTENYNQQVNYTEFCSKCGFFTCGI